MKKGLVYIFVIVFCLSNVSLINVSVHAQDEGSSSSGSAPNPDDVDSLQTLDQVEQALAKAKDELAAKGFSIKLIQKIKKLEAKLLSDVTGDKIECVSIYDQLVGRCNDANNKLEQKSCPDSQRVSYRGMCNPFSSNFSECEANEHGHGGHSEHNGGGMMMASKPKPCVTDTALTALDEVLTNVQLLGQDADFNGKPDFCEKP